MKIDNITITALAKVVLVAFRSIKDEAAARNAILMYNELDLSVIPGQLRDELHKQRYYTLQAYPSLVEEAED